MIDGIDLGPETDRIAPRLGLHAVDTVPIGLREDFILNGGARDQRLAVLYRLADRLQLPVAGAMQANQIANGLGAAELFCFDDVMGKTIVTGPAVPGEVLGRFQHAGFFLGAGLPFGLIGQVNVKM